MAVLLGYHHMVLVVESLARAVSLWLAQLQKAASCSVAEFHVLRQCLGLEMAKSRGHDFHLR